ncbi:RrF2 family transcriptional regulator [Paenibacillus daejeonensis]|uniref:RrF2 family transcriptional regulator n=1 Tax=Paenibacillus daejeonensis TaxID=135193 RepID=UPI000379816D|nr:Rrf2 family transcriptional regulator [Paenibacillus daejeonensis]
MQLTKAVDQAICIIIFLATQEYNKPLSSDEISKKLQVSPSYMKKITRKLVVKKIITSVPGQNGGISLAKRLEEINLLDVIEAMEGPISIYPDTGLIRFAFKGGQHTETGTEILRGVFHKADQLLIDYFAGVTAADLLRQSFGSDHIPTMDWNHMTIEDVRKRNRDES